VCVDLFIGGEGVGVREVAGLILVSKNPVRFCSGFVWQAIRRQTAARRGVQTAIP